ncbi:trypsin-3 isoform X2 [Anoplophora glabripennis]|uniref:trypsin-3 isoform X2 n=1 Tax=Anoplophora glabripennis TaxID=217634 RepID=UPI000874C8AE|nr:trypsin-3 isoform X2 [Anoplophora glabripennis]
MGFSMLAQFGQETSVPRLDGRIVGGEATSIATYPYQISLQLLSTHICGGAIISSDWIITAAHCVVDSPVPSYLSVRAGSSTRNSGGQVYTVVKVISHPSFLTSTLDYDVALLQLSSSISTTNASAISLAASGTGPAANLTAVVTGWGATSEGGSAATTLQVVEVPVISRTDCETAYPLRLTDRMFCAGILGVGGKDACQGDSGGPVVIDGLLYGLVSWGDGCARDDAPGVYTNLQVLRDWISTNSGV